MPAIGDLVSQMNTGMLQRTMAEYSGGNRGYKMTGMTEIDAKVVSLGELERQIAEFDENLAGPKLTAAERALFTRRRKEAYDALHPEAKAGAIRAKAANAVMGHDADASFAPTSTQDTATRTGDSLRAVQQNAERGEKIDEPVLAQKSQVRKRTEPG